MLTNPTSQELIHAIAALRVGDALIVSNGADSITLDVQYTSEYGRHLIVFKLPNGNTEAVPHSYGTHGDTPYTARVVREALNIK